MHKKTFVIEMLDGIDIQPETIVYALSYISNHDFTVTEAAQPGVQQTLLKAMFTVLCPACGDLAEFSHLGVEVIADGVDLGVCKCGATVKCHLTCAVPDVAITCANCGEYHSIYLPCKGGKREATT